MEQLREQADRLQEEQPARDPYIGREIGNLKLVQKVGIGGFGSVYRAEHVGLKTSFAVKILHFQMQGAPRAAERFRREALAIAQLSHQNIVRVSDFGEFADGGPYLVMDFLSGHNLEECFHHHQRFDLFAIQDIIEQICAALEYIHRKGIVHRDLKPANISLESERQGGATTVKLFDFGIAALEEDASITHTGVCMGSPLYMSPEQATGETKHADGRTDLYSLGVITYELLAGFPPFQGSVKSVMYKQVHQKPMALREVRPHIQWSKRLEKMVQKALAKEPNDRFQNAAEFRQAFNEACEAQLRKTPDGRLWTDAETQGENHTRDLRNLEALGLQDSFDVEALRRQRRLRPLKAMAAVSLLSLLVGASLWYFWLGPRAFRQSHPQPTPMLQPGISAQQSGTQGTPRQAGTAPQPGKRAALVAAGVPARPTTARSTNPIPLPSRPLVVRPRPAPAKRQEVQVILTSSPRRAYVYIKGKRSGRTPYTLKGHQGGSFRVELRARGRRSRVVAGRFTQAATRTLRTRLPRKASGKSKKGPFDIADPI